MTATILVVDDEITIVNTIRAYLTKEGYTVHVAYDGPTALTAVRTWQPDLIILDIMLPGMNGLELLQQIRRESAVYVLLLSAKADEMDKILGLTVGADDYMTKPFSPRELVARVQARLRRQQGDAPLNQAFQFGELAVDVAARQVRLTGQDVPLTSTEFDLLHTLVRHVGHVLSREQLIEHVWHGEYYGDDRVVDVSIGRLRRKIEPDPTNPRYILTVRGAGYRFEGGA